MPYPASKSEVYILTLQAIEGRISESDFQRLEEYLKESPDYREIYSDLNIMYAYLRKSALTFSVDSEDRERDSSFDVDFWQKLAQHEKTAPEIEIPQKQPQRELIQKVVYPHREKRKLSTFSKVFLAMNAAAILFIILFLKFTPPEPVEVATLSDSINAKWADSDASMHKGARLVNSSEKLMLREGWAELTFDNEARAVIEAPAEFQILADDRIGLAYGKVYAIVPPDAIGFSVYTPNAKIIDLGTEFGIQSDPYGNTELHVLKGRTNFIANAQGQKTNISVKEGAARRLSGTTGEVKTTPMRQDMFVRSIDSKNDIIWRGQKKIHLADIVDGGNGFGTENLDMGIDPMTGKPTNQTLKIGKRQSANDYRPVPSIPYIDGVFVPNGQTPQVVSSQRHLFRECPVTDGSCSQGIWGLTNFDSQVLENVSNLNATTPYLYLHANMGITFDLNAMRRSLSDVHIARFQSKCGVRKYAMHPIAGNADFWVLVDGKVRFKQLQVKTGEVHSIDIELSENDHFLTLVETDGGDPAERVVDGEVISAINSDWGMFADPVLVLE